MDKRIKLVATDVDGTLVKESSPEVPQDVIEAIRMLVDRGYKVAIATGRQYGSVRKVFASVERKLYFIVENGAHILYGDETIRKTVMKREDVVEIMQDLRSLYKDDCHVVASTANGCFIESKDDDFYHLIKDHYRNEVTKTEDILAEDVEYLKLAVYKKGDIHDIGNQNLIPRWEKRVKCCFAGAEWVDFMDASVDKGEGLEFLMNQVGACPETTMAFGDNDNDIGMLQAAGESYAVENANEKVRSAAKHTCKPYWENGAMIVMQDLLKRNRQETEKE